MRSRRGRRHRAQHGADIERAKPAGRTSTLGDSGRRTGARGTRLRFSTGGNGHGAIRRRVVTARRRERLRSDQDHVSPSDLLTIELMAVKTNAARILDAAGIHYEL